MSQNLHFQLHGELRRPHSTYQKVVQGKCPLHFLHFNGPVCSNTLVSNTSALTNSLLFRANSTRKILEHLVCSNTSGFQLWGPLARTDFLSALCGPPKNAPRFSRNSRGDFEGLTKILRNSHQTSRHELADKSRKDTHDSASFCWVGRDNEETHITCSRPLAQG